MCSATASFISCWTIQLRTGSVLRLIQSLRTFGIRNIQLGSRSSATTISVRGPVNGRKLRYVPAIDQQVMFDLRRDKTVNARDRPAAALQISGITRGHQGNGLGTGVTQGSGTGCVEPVNVSPAEAPDRPSSVVPDVDPPARADNRPSVRDILQPAVAA